MASPPSAPDQPAEPKSAASWSALVFVALVTAAVTGGAAFLLNRPQTQPIVVHPPPTLAPSPMPAAASTPSTILVFVSGSVQQPGLYEVASDSRVAVALEAAGGFTVEADFNAVNQAQPLYDGAQVHVPAMDEVASEPPAGVSGDTRSAGIDIGSSGKIDINSASLSELETLPGIGAVKAQAIIDGRPYNSIDDLDIVTGIGPKTIEQLRDLVDAR